MIGVYPFYRLTAIQDADTVRVVHSITQVRKTVRLCGIDSPETKRNAKLRNDEATTHIAGDFLIYLGKLARQWLRSILPIGTRLTLEMESTEPIDRYGRVLAYLIADTGSGPFSVNEALLSAGYAKAYNKYYCTRLAQYQLLNQAARLAGNGLYALTPVF